MAHIEPRSEREAYVEGLFSAIASRYDLLNTVISLGWHKAWRRRAASTAGLKPGGRALDVCCGTGDFGLELARRVGSHGSVVGVDFSLAMVELARRKASQHGCGWVSFLEANACQLPFADCSFDCATVGFGLRNVVSVRDAVSEMTRVVRPGGRVVSLEISGITSPVLVVLWRLYFNRMMPLVARLFRGGPEAYEYLPRSVRGFMSREELAREFSACGLRDVEVHGLMFGAVCIHVGTRPE